MNEWIEDLTMPDDLLIKLCEGDYVLAEQEGVEESQSDRIELIAVCYGVLGDKENFKVWARRGVAAFAHTEPSKAACFSEWMTNPWSMPRWGTRKAQKLI